METSLLDPPFPPPPPSRADDGLRVPRDQIDSISSTGMWQLEFASPVRKRRGQREKEKKGAGDPVSLCQWRWKCGE